MCVSVQASSGGNRAGALRDCKSKTSAHRQDRPPRNTAPLPTPADHPPWPRASAADVRRSPSVVYLGHPQKTVEENGEISDQKINDFQQQCREFKWKRIRTCTEAKLYHDDFNHKDAVTLEHELGLYIDNVLNDTRFASLPSIGDLAKLMVDTRKHLSYPLVYRLLKLAPTLPVATATVERCFSAMKIVKNALRNKIGDDFLSYSLICFVEKDLLDTIPNEVIIDRFHKTKDHRGLK